MKRNEGRLGIMCKMCGWIGVSWNRHDYKTCSCDNQAMVDGGTDYLRCGAKDMSQIVYVNVKENKGVTDGCKTGG